MSGYWEIFDIWSGRVVFTTRSRHIARWATARIWRRSWDYARVEPHPVVVWTEEP